MIPGVGIKQAQSAAYHYQHTDQANYECCDLRELLVWSRLSPRGAPCRYGDAATMGDRQAHDAGATPPPQVPTP
jgi:hypothetical protein